MHGLHDLLEHGLYAGIAVSCLSWRMRSFAGTEDACKRHFFAEVEEEWEGNVSDGRSKITTSTGAFIVTTYFRMLPYIAISMLGFNAVPCLSHGGIAWPDILQLLIERIFSAFRIYVCQ
jgi:hypothetical protein